MPSFRTLAAQRAAPATERVVQVTITGGAPAALVLPANGRRRSLEVWNLTAGVVYVGFAPGVDATNGFPVWGSGQANDIAGTASWPVESTPGGPVHIYGAQNANVLVREASHPAAF